MDTYSTNDQDELESSLQQSVQDTISLGHPQKNDQFELFILSEAGKPIYTFTKREDAVTLMPLCSAFIDYARKTQKETLHSITTSDDLNINFSLRPPLIIIVIHQGNSFVHVETLVEQVEAQIISILTAKTLRRVFEERPTFDLKRLLYGSEKLLDSITKLSAFVNRLLWPPTQAFLAVTSSQIPSAANPNPNAPLLSPTGQSLPSRPHRILVPIIPMLPSARDSINSILSNVINSSSKNMLFSLLFHVRPLDQDLGENEESGSEADRNSDIACDIREPEVLDEVQLVTVCNHHDKHRIKIADIHLILSLLVGSKVQLQAAESLWMPVCLPRFNQDAFLHAYISYINNGNNCLVMMSVDRDEFSNCQVACKSIEDKLDKDFFNEFHTRKDKFIYSPSPLVHPVLVQLQEKLSRSDLAEDQLAQIDQQAQIYNSKLEQYHARQLQFLWYQTNKQVLWWQRSPSRQPSEILYYVTRKMLQSSLKHLWLKLANDTVFLGWQVPTFQLYAQFDATISSNEATEVIQRITSWIKKEEDNFSIKDYR